MYNRVIDFIEKNDILYKYQFGFRKGYGTNLAIITLVDKIVNGFENGNFVVGVFLDFESIWYS